MHPGTADAADHLVYSADSVEVKMDSAMAEENATVVKTLRNLDSLAMSFGARLLFVMPPNRNNLWGDANNEAAIRFNEMLASGNINSVDLAHLFAEVRKVKQQIYWKTDSHWNGFAHRIASDAIADKLLEMIR